MPHRLVFAARGTGPFQLAYGHRAATVGAFAIGTLVPGYESDESLERRAATAGITIGIAGGADAQRSAATRSAASTSTGKRWALWGSLVLGVAVLGWMALRLGRQMSRPA